MEKFTMKCSDPNTIKQLKELGYVVIDEKNGMTTFLNDLSKPQTFDKKKVVYSNVLVM